MALSYHVSIKAPYWHDRFIELLGLEPIIIFGQSLSRLVQDKASLWEILDGKSSF